MLCRRRRVRRERPEPPGDHEAPSRPNPDQKPNGRGQEQSRHEDEQRDTHPEKREYDRGTERQGGERKRENGKGHEGEEGEDELGEEEGLFRCSVLSAFGEPLSQKLDSSSCPIDGGTGGVICTYEKEGSLLGKAEGRGIEILARGRADDAVELALDKGVDAASIAAPRMWFAMGRCGCHDGLTEERVAGYRGTGRCA